MDSGSRKYTDPKAPVLARFCRKPNDKVTEQRNRDATLHTTSFGYYLTSPDFIWRSEVEDLVSLAAVQLHLVARLL